MRADLSSVSLMGAGCLWHGWRDRYEAERKYSPGSMIEPDAPASLRVLALFYVSLGAALGGSWLRLWANYRPAH